MALVVADRVQETSTTSGTGTLTLAGAVVGYQTFSSAIGNTNTTYYTIYDLTAYDWEVGIGTVGAGTLTRDTVLSNSAGTTAFISFSSNVKSVFCTYPAEKSVNVDANGDVNILTYVPNTTTTVGTLNVGDGTYSFSQSGQIATFAGSDTIVNGISVQNTSSSNTAYSALQVGANNYNNGYYLMLGTNSSTYSYAAAGYANNNANKPNANYIEANKSDLSIITWDSNDIHFIQNASAATTDSMTLFASGGVSLGGYGDPGIGTLYANNVYLGFNTITAAAGTTILTNASAAWQNVVGTTTQSIQLPDATTLFKGFAFTITSSSTGSVTIKDDASATIDTIVTGGSAIMVLTDNSTVAGTWRAYSYLPSSYDFSATTANFGGATITNALWNGTTIATGYGGTGLTTFAAANNAIYSTSSSALAAGTLPIQAGGTAATTFTANGVIYGNGTSALGVTAAGTTGQVLIGNTGAAPTWGTVSSSLVSSFQTSLSGLTPSTATTGAVTLAGTLGATSGGTGLTSYTTGDIIYASATNTLSKLADVATGNALISGGVGVAPSWGKIGLTTHVSGTLPTANGGTNLTSFTSGGAVYATSTSALTTGTLPVASGGTGSSTAFTTGSVVFAGASGTYTQDNANFFWDNTNSRLGIGTTSPTQKLHVNGSILVADTFQIISSGTGGSASAPTYTWGGQTAKTGMYLPADNTIAWSTNTAERMRIDSSGNVGIGTASPQTKLNLLASSGAGTVAATPSIVLTNKNTTNATFNAAVIAVDTYRDVADPHYSGAIWFTRTPTSANLSSSSDIVFGAMGSNSTSSLPTERMRISSTGGLSVGTTADPGAGAIYATGNVTAFYTSDKRFKENIQDIPNALDKVNAIGGKLFDWTDDYIKNHGGEDGYFVRKSDFGVIAQDVEAVFPEAVRTKPDETLAVDYEKLCALAFAAIKELKAEIDELKGK